MNREFVERIENPRKLQLQQLQQDARSTVLKRFESYRMTDVPDHVVRKMTYAYYHDWEQDDPSYVFLLADPGVPGEHVIFETDNYLTLGEGCHPLEAVQVDRRFGARWLVKRQYTNFSEEFVQLCRESGLISSSKPWWRYILSEDFFDDFYMTDVIKYRSASPTTADVNVSFTESLVHELEYVEPELVFAFGKRAWDTLRERLGAKPVDDAPKSQGISDAHGILHTTNRLIDTEVLPVGHPSTNFRGAQISHDDYMGRLEDGVAEWTSRR